MIYKLFLSSTLIVCASLFFSCNGDSKKTTSSDSTKQISSVNIPNFNADSAFSYIDKQVSFGPRVPNSEAHKKCADYLTLFLKNFTEHVIVQETKVKAYNGTMLPIKNIIASYKPEINNRIFICSHWDSRPYADEDPDPKNHKKPIPGANDGASGVGVIMELARLLKENPAPIGIDLILFDAEDYGQPENSELPEVEDSWCLGSQFWSKNPHVKGYYAKYGILLDMVGAKDATFTMEEISRFYAPDILNKVWGIANTLGYSSYFLYTKTAGVTDDHLYINQITKIPTIDVIDRNSSTPSGFNKNWHTLKDDMEGIDKTTLKAVGQTMLNVIFQEQPIASN